MTLVSVIPHSRIGAVHAPGTPTAACMRRACKGPHTSDWRRPLGSADNRHRVRAEMRVVDLPVALATAYPTEAHFAGYVLVRGGVPVGTQPRIAKDALAWLRSEGFDVLTTCFLADWDTPGHVPWTDALRAEFDALWSTCPPLATAGVYLSPKGARIVQPLAEPVPVERGEAGLRAWIGSLIAAGLPEDLATVKDWTRLMRTPHHTRPTGPVRAGWDDYSRLAPIACPDAAVEPEPARRARGERGAVPSFDDACPADLALLADHLGDAIRDTVRADWRRCYSALAGALLGRGVAPSALPAVIARVHAVDPAWLQYLGDRVEIARTTAARHAAGEACIGYRVLRAEFPGVADALDDHAAPGAVRRVLSQLSCEPAITVSLPDALATIEREIRAAYGCTVIEATTGIGKTTAAIAVAASLPEPTGDRTPPGARLAISAPTHRLAQQTAAKLPGRTMRLYSPLAHHLPNGAPTCRWHESGAALAAGGQSVGLEFCEGRRKSPCPDAASCPAKSGWEGNRHGNLVTGPHALLGRLDAAAGPAGTLVVDEPADAVDTFTVTLDDLDTARRYLDAFAPRYASAMRPALAAWDAWIRTVAPVPGSAAPAPGTVAPVPGEAYTVPNALRWGALHLPPEIREELDPFADPGDAVLLAAGDAILPNARSKAPPLRWLESLHARENPARAAELGRASAVLDLLWRGVVEIPPHSVRVDEERVATVCAVNGALAAALRRDGPVVILDADARIHVPAIERVLGSAPRFVAVHVGDGAPIERTIYATNTANRRTWLPRGVPDWDAGIIGAVRAALRWARGGVLGIITWATIEAALGATVTPAAEGPRAAWKAAGLSARLLDRTRDRLAPVVAEFCANGTILLGHYGGLEGLDYLAGCDAIATLGDPRPNLGEVRDRAEFLGLDPDGRVDALAAAELGQAHGRLRTIHRTRAGRALHVGCIVPHGWTGLAIDVQQLPTGRPRIPAAMAPPEFAARREAMGLGIRAMGRLLRCDPETVRRYESGSKPVPEAILRALSAASEVSQKPPVNKIFTGGFCDTQLDRSAGIESDEVAPSRGVTVH